MHQDELDIDAPLVRRLIAAQFPQWAGLAIDPVHSSGTDNAMFRLGADMAVRLPRHERAAKQVEKERRWLPLLAPHLPLATPVPLAKGAPAEGYQLSWSVCRWLEGTAPDKSDDEMARDLAQFVLALQRIDATNGLSPGHHNFWRGVPLAARDAYTREAIAQLHGMVDVDAVTAAWQADLSTPSWTRPPVWIHGDLSAGNLLVKDGRLSAVIDFGGLAVGDPACDLIVAWSFFSRNAREAFRAALAVDDATWRRGRGWALSTALVALPYYHMTNPVIAETSRHTIAAVLADYARGDRLPP